jgi:hypothetical protein
VLHFWLKLGVYSRGEDCASKNSPEAKERDESAAIDVPQHRGHAEKAKKAGARSISIHAR